MLVHCSLSFPRTELRRRRRRLWSIMLFAVRSVSARDSEPVPKVLALMAHPDDIEITCAGTLVLLRRAGWDVHLATMTAGDMGSMQLSRAAICPRAPREAAASARMLGAAYTCLGFNDLTILCDEPSKRRVSATDSRGAPRPADHAPARGLHGRPRGDLANRARGRLRVNHAQLEGRCNGRRPPTLRGAAGDPLRRSDRHTSITSAVASRRATSST